MPVNSNFSSLVAISLGRLYMQSKLNPLYRTKLCRHFLKGKCSRSDCAFLHAAVEPERSFRSHPRIENSNHLVHREQEVLEEDGEDEDDVEEDDEDIEDDSSTNLKMFPCKFFARGICSRGKLCKFLHELSADGAPIGPPPGDGGWSLNPYRNRRGPYFTIPDNFIFIAGKSFEHAIYLFLNLSSYRCGYCSE